jgi:UDP-N-acetylmuramate dehydrogenase
MMEKSNYSLLQHNTFGIDVETKRFIEYQSVTELKQILANIDLTTTKYLHIGEGSNLLFINNFEGIIFHSAIRGIERIKEDDEYVWLKAGAGVIWDDFVEFCVSNNLSGAENLSLIPGEVGASAVQNIGAYGAEAKDIIDEVEAVNISNGNEKVFTKADCQYSYRQSIFKNELKNKYFITYVIYKLDKRPLFNCEYGNIKKELESFDEINLRNIRQAIINIRNSKLPDPKIQGNAGSFFMNPIIGEEQFKKLQVLFPDIPHYDLPDNKVKVPAGWMIDQCGWKGKGLGPVAIHDKQALVLVNRGGATGKDVLKLSDEVCKSVKEKFGIEIHPEVNVIK